jgi:hypothetical protein
MSPCSWDHIFTRCLGAWRMVSEDSDQLGSRFLAIHCGHHFDNVSQSRMAQVIAVGDSIHATGELLKVTTFCGSQRMGPKERDDYPYDIRAFSHGVSIHMLAMVVIPLIDVDRSHTEEGAEILKTTQAAGTLRYCELTEQLNASLVALSVGAVWLSYHTDREASFSVHKTNNPADRDQSFLLIVRSPHIVTVRNWSGQ